jgi:hypothetical protein
MFILLYIYTLHTNIYTYTSSPIYLFKKKKMLTHIHTNALISRLTITILLHSKKKNYNNSTYIYYITKNILFLFLIFLF